MESERIEARRVLEHAAWAQRVARAMVRDEHLAEDLAQDALAAGLLRKAPPRAGLRAWLYGTLRNLRSQAARGEQHRRERELRARATEPPATPDELLEKVEAQRAVSEAVIQLPEALRSALILRYYEQLPVREVARLLQISEKAAESRLQRGLQKLRESFQSRHGSAWTAAVAPLLPSSSLALTATLVMNTKVKLIGAGACALILLGAFAAYEGLRSNPTGELAARADAGPASHAEADLPDASAASPAGTSSEPSPIRTPAPTGARLRVLDDAGAPVAGARFAVFPAGAREALASGITEDDGSAAIPDRADGLHAVLTAPGHAPWWGPLPPGSSPEIRLPLGKVVSGLVHVDGKPATRSLALELRSDQRLIPRDAVPTPILALVGIDPQATGTFAGACDASGRFAFAGLPPLWEGAIRCTDLLYMNPGQPANILWPPPWTQIPAPHRDFILELRESPAARGRVVLHDERTPAFPGWVITALHYPRKGRSLNVAELHPDGTFEIVMRSWHDPAEKPIRLEVKVATIACPEKVWNFEPPPEELAIGTLILPLTRRLSLEVTLPNGQPLAGASAGVLAFNRAVGPSEADGKLVLEVAEGGGQVEVTAPGYVTERITLPDNREPLDLRVVLQPARDLRLLIRTPKGEPIAGATVSLLIDQDAIDAPPWVSTESRDVASIMKGQLTKTRSGSEGQMELLAESDSEGRVTLRYLKPGEMVLARATPAGSSEMQEIALGPMPAAGDLEHVFVMDSGRRTFTGRIIDPDGRGVRPEALKLVAKVGSETVHLATPAVDEEGVFYADLLDAGAFFVVIEAPGFASVRREVISFDEDAGPMVFRLGSGRALEVKALDEDGNPLAGVAAVHLEDRDSLHWKLNDGSHVFRDLPAEDLSVSVSIGGRAYWKQASESDSIVEFILPVHGALELSLNESLRSSLVESNLRLYLAPLEGGKQIVHWFRITELKFPLVPPGDYWARLAETTGFDTEDTIGDWKKIVVRPGETTDLVF